MNERTGVFFVRMGNLPAISDDFTPRAYEQGLLIRCGTLFPRTLGAG